jgi:uncharacterized protein (TIGR02145 family)
MKKVAILFFAILAVAELWSQSYEIDFLGTGSATVVDSVIVENLKQGIFLTLKGTDALKLNIPVSGIDNNASETKTLQVYPNPMTEMSEIQFSIQENGNVLVAVYDMSGRTVIQLTTFLVPGTHKYSVRGLNPGMYVVRIKGQSLLYSAKLVSQNYLKEEAKITYVSSNDLQPNQIQYEQLKSTTSAIEMSYNDGDRLKFTGISGNYSTIITHILTENKTITFDFMNCTDADSNHYPVVTIGEQTWMAENLKTTHFFDGTPIPNITGEDNWAALTSADPAYCWYNDDSNTYAQTYGALYNWPAAMNSAPSSNTNPSEVQGVCPTGWHLPSDNEWKELTDYLGGIGVAGGKLKETGKTHWISPNTGATNESGFTALPSGCRDQSGQFIYFSEYTAWWTTTESSTDNAWGRGVYYPDGTVYRMDEGGSKGIGVSVRCVND